MINNDMNLWRQIKSAHAQSETENGQILIIILLVLVVGVSIVLSLASRSLTDIRTTTSTEQSNRAYFAAEAGVERALQQIKDTTIDSTGANIIGTGDPLSNNASYTGRIDTTGGSTNAFAYDAIKDITVQTNLKPDINNDTGLNGGTLTVYWHANAVTTAADTAALEVTILRKNSAGTYLLEKYACDPYYSSDRVANGFSCAAPATYALNGSCDSIPTSNKNDRSYCYKATFPISSTAGDKTLLARIRPLYSNDSIAVKYTNGVVPLPQQGYKITSTGVGSDGSSRKLEVYRSFPSLPTVFDFVLFNGSSNALTKP